jgi:hypothetical protein
MIKINDTISKKQVLELMEALKIGQRINIRNDEGKLFLRKEAIDIHYNYKTPSGYMENFNFKEVKKWVLNGKNKYKVIGLPCGLNSFAYELEKIF